MPEICYKSKRFSKKSQALITIAREFIDEYMQQGFNLTLRQLYYRFVSRDIIPNTERSYKSLGSVISDARMAGLLDWNAIVDRQRVKKGQQHWNSPSEILDAAASSYRIDKWDNQPIRVECWVEKEALIDVIARAAFPLDVDHFSCKGYVSQSAMWRAAQRLIDYEMLNQRTVILHLGDHDPSGIDMTRDIQDRLSLFGSSVTVIRIALQMSQIEELNPPPNPAKVTDARARSYIETYGDSSWELDALEPKYLVRLITEKIIELRDNQKWEEAEKIELEERALIKSASEEIRKKMSTEGPPT